MNPDTIHHKYLMQRRVVYLLTICLSLSACSTDHVEDLRQYVAETKIKSKGPIEPMPQIEPLKPYVYTSENRRAPFSAKMIINPSTAKIPNGLDPSQLDATRRKEPLEAFSLDTMKLAGIIERNGEIWAIIKAPDSIVYWVKRGNYLGLNYGKITHITENKVDLTETIPDGTGGWQSRPASLVLAE